MEVVYLNDAIYLKVNDLYFLLTEELINDMPDLVDVLFDNLGINVTTSEIADIIKEKLKESESVDFKDYLKYIENIELSSNNLRLSINANVINLGDYIINVSIDYNQQEIKNISIDGLNIDGNVIGLDLVVKHYYSEINVNNK